MIGSPIGGGGRASLAIWILGILGIAWYGFGCFDFTMTATRNEAYMSQFPQEMLDYWYAAPLWMMIIWAVGVFGGLFGAVALILRRRLAVLLFAVSFTASLVSFVIGWTDKNAPKMEGAELMPFVILLAGLGYALFARRQAGRGVLR